MLSFHLCIPLQYHSLVPLFSFHFSTFIFNIGAYSPLFRAGGSHIRIRLDYPHILQWLQRCWDIEGVPESIDIQDATLSYYKQLFPLNPGGLLPTPITSKDIGLKDKYIE